MLLYFFFRFDILLTLTFYRFKIYFSKKKSWRWLTLLTSYAWKSSKTFITFTKIQHVQHMKPSVCCFILHPVCSAVLYSVAVICSGGHCLNSMTSECSITVVTVVKCQFACVRPVEEASLVSQMKKKAYPTQQILIDVIIFGVKLRLLFVTNGTSYIKRPTAVSLQTICFLFAQFLIIWYWQMV